ncbi:uncharacterized protein TNCV_5141531 [Trichonephila clavipes]|nr:uncharacterized protein TNCV_5141531 [Trichonephila clavipes]
MSVKWKYKERPLKADKLEDRTQGRMTIDATDALHIKELRNPGFQEYNEDIETRMACDAEDCGFQMLNDNYSVNSVQEESDPIDEGNNESSKGPSKAEAFSALETAMECDRFHILHESHSVFGYPNNRVFERCPVPVDFDKRRSTVLLSSLGLKPLSSMSSL